MGQPIVVSCMLGNGRRCSVALVALAIWAWGLAAATPATANQASIWASLSNNWVAGEGFAAGTDVDITITNATETHKFAKATQTGGDGRFFAQTNTIGGIDLVPEDTIEVSVGPITRILVLDGPLSFDVAADPRQPFGVLPAGATVEVHVFGSDCSARTSITDNGDGMWSADFSGVCPDGLGVDPHGNAVLSEIDGDRTIAEPASLRVSLTKNWIRGQAFASYGQVSIWIDADPSIDPPTEEVVIDSTGNFFVSLERDLVVGDTVDVFDGTTRRSLTVGGPLTIAVDTDTARASGLLPTSSRIRVDLAGSECGSSAVVGDDGSIDGVWSADFSADCPGGLGAGPGINQWGFETFGWAVLFDGDVDATVAEAGAQVDITSAPGEPTPVGAEITVEGVFTDGAQSGPHTAEWNWGDDSTSPGAVSQVHGSGSVTGTHIYTAPGVYSLRLTVTNDYGVASTDVYQYVVIYDSEGGFVMGGGWIDSPEGSYAADASLQGRAHFGFVSKYKKGATAPVGNTEFQFNAGALNFHSDSYEWLVVTGFEDAKFKGVGTINSGGAYKFQVWAGDGDPDTFRIKIWTEDDTTGVETVVYDNGLEQALGAGSVTVHAKK